MGGSNFPDDFFGERLLKAERVREQHRLELEEERLQDHRAGMISNELPTLRKVLWFGMVLNFVLGVFNIVEGEYCFGLGNAIVVYILYWHLKFHKALEKNSDG